MIFRPENRLLYEVSEEAIRKRFPGAEIRETKSQVGFFRGCGFAWASEKGKRFIISIALPHKIESPRLFQAAEPYPGRWTNHIKLSSEDEIDEELLGWIADAHEFAVERGIKRGKI